MGRDSECYNKTLKSLLKQYSTELYSTYSDLKTRFIERFNRNLIHIINKPMFINGDCSWVSILIDAVVTYNNNIHSTNNMTPVDASNNPDNVEYIISISTKIKTKGNLATSNLKSAIMSYSDKLNIFSKRYNSNWNKELFEINEVLKTQPPTYNIEDMNGEIIGSKYYEQGLLKSESDFESNKKDLESFNINIIAGSQ